MLFQRIPKKNASNATNLNGHQVSDLIISQVGDQEGRANEFEFEQNQVDQINDWDISPYTQASNQENQTVNFLKTYLKSARKIVGIKTLKKATVVEDDPYDLEFEQFATPELKNLYENGDL